MPRAFAIVLLLLLLPAELPRAEESTQVVRLASLEWPPYAGEALPGQGASVAVVRAALAAMGQRLQVEFMPWTRAVAVGQDSGSGFHGYFPEYRSSEVETSFQLSQSIGSGPLGFVEKRATPVRWDRLEDLSGIPIGVVRGYVNTAEFDAMVASGELTAVPASDDLANIRKVLSGRLPLAVIDRHVLAYLIRHERGMVDAPRVLQFNARALEEKSLHVALQRSPEGGWALRMIDAGLRRIDRQAIAAPYFEPSPP